MFVSMHDEDDLRAFREAMRGTQPLHSDRAESAAQKPAPEARFRVAQALFEPEFARIGGE